MNFLFLAAVFICYSVLIKKNPAEIGEKCEAGWPMLRARLRPSREAGLSIPNAGARCVSVAWTAGHGIARERRRIGGRAVVSVEDGSVSAGVQVIGVDVVFERLFRVVHDDRPDRAVALFVALDPVARVMAPRKAGVFGVADEVPALRSDGERIHQLMTLKRLSRLGFSMARSKASCSASASRCSVVGVVQRA